MHTPFCLRKCYYCIYNSRVASGSNEMEDFYKNVIPRQVEEHRDIFENVTFDQAYFGGGTPTITAAETLDAIYKSIPGFKDIPLKTSEASPFTINDEHIELFGRYGFSYISMGVQTLSREVLEKQNRLVAGVEKLRHICRSLDQNDIISNFDLIFYLDSGEREDLAITRGDMDIIMSDIRPVSITLHYNYRAGKTYEKRKAMMDLIKEMLEKYPEYRPVNTLLEEGDVELDIKNAAEYRIMRKKEDFNFYMLPKAPDTHAYGHNILSIGEYDGIKPSYNYYYLFSNKDKYTLKDFFKKSRATNIDFERIREGLGLAHHNFTQNNTFFRDDSGKNEFKEIIKQTRYPYYEIN